MREEVAALGPEGSLCGVVSLPPSRERTEWGAILLNAGLLHRVGPNRWYVPVARSLAELGIPALRYDRSGVGDSGPRKGGGRFERVAVEEAGQAMRWLADHHGCRRFALLGMCAGAEVAFKTACQDRSVGAVVLINATRYLEEPDPAFLTRVKRKHDARRRWRLMLARPSWRRSSSAAMMVPRSSARSAGASGVPCAGDPAVDPPGTSRTSGRCSTGTSVSSCSSRRATGPSNTRARSSRAPPIVGRGAEGH